ncbi:hypothetical protein ACFQX6_04355 [Streptosporangium lutulentum]
MPDEPVDAIRMVLGPDLSACWGRGQDIVMRRHRTLMRFRAVSRFLAGDVGQGRGAGAIFGTVRDRY